MSSNLTPMSTSGKESRKHYFQDIKSEIKKISWTTKDELIFSTKLVVLSTVVFGLAIYFMEIVIRACLGFLGLIAKLIGG